MIHNDSQIVCLQDIIVLKPNQTHIPRVFGSFIACKAA